MPIEIKITDLTNLTKREINQLQTFLRVLDSEVTDPSSFESFASTVLRETQDSQEEAKPRKKRKNKSSTEEIVNSPDENEWSLKNSMFTEEELKTDEIPSSHADVDITFDDLIAYVLEATRTKIVSYEEVMNLLSKFEVPGLNELKNFPHLINPFYKALKEMEHDEKRKEIDVD